MGEIIVNFEEAKGINHVPLNRIGELPERIIREIVPVLFDNPDWKISEDNLYHLNKKENTYYVFKEFTKYESFAVQYFNQNVTLSEISAELSGAMNLELKDAYKQVTDLFFQLILLLVCHPLEQYDFDEIAKQEPQ